MTSDPRADRLRDWIATRVPDAEGTLEPVTGDASFRRYFRVATPAGPRIAMDAPPEREPVAPFVDVAARLRAAGVQAPRILELDTEQGFLLMDDLGDRLYLDELGAASADSLYSDALVALVRMQSDVSTDGLPEYDRARLEQEMALFPDWLLGAHLGIEPERIKGDLAPTTDALASAALEQPRAFVHRDYHSRNLMVTTGANPGVLDFQDAVAGPLTYDLVSLLRDCYIAWPDERITAWIGQYRDLAAANGIDLPEDCATLRRWFDLMGVQRHLKAIGIFARLWHRDGKDRYLADIPRTWAYIRQLFGRYPELDGLARIDATLGLSRRLEGGGVEA